MANSLKANAKQGIDPLILFANKLKEVQAYDSHIFAFVTQFDLIEPASYKAAMSSNQVEKWSKVIISEWDSLIANNT